MTSCKKGSLEKFVKDHVDGCPKVSQYWKDMPNCEGFSYEWYYNYTGYSNNDSQITLSNYFINSHGVVHYLFPDTRRIWRPYTWYILQTSSEFCGTSLNHLSGKLLDYFFRSHCAWETLCLCVQGGEWGAKGTVLGRVEGGISGEREGYQRRGRDIRGEGGISGER